MEIRNEIYLNIWDGVGASIVPFFIALVFTGLAVSNFITSSYIEPYALVDVQVELQLIGVTFNGTHYSNYSEISSAFTTSGSAFIYFLHLDTVDDDIGLPLRGNMWLKFDTRLLNTSQSTVILAFEAGTRDMVSIVRHNTPLIITF